MGGRHLPTGENRDETAIEVVDGRVTVVSEGEWKLLHS